MATRRDLELAVKRLNDSYMQKEPNIFEPSYAYGGTKIVLTGKSRKVGKKYVWRGIGSGAANLTSGYVSATETLAQLGMILSDKDQIKRFIKIHRK